jgi:hypothetical protein
VENEVEFLNCFVDDCKNIYLFIIMLINFLIVLTDMGLRRDLLYSREYEHGTYRVDGNCSYLDRDPEDRIVEWLKENSLGEVCLDLGKKAELLFDSDYNALCSVHASMENLPHSFVLSESGDKFSYAQRVHIRLSSTGRSISPMLAGALDERGFEEISSPIHS